MFVPIWPRVRRFLFHSLKIEETSWHRGSSKMLGKCWEGGIFHITTWNINTTNDCINDKSITRQLQLTWWQHQKSFLEKNKWSCCITMTILCLLDLRPAGTYVIVNDSIPVTTGCMTLRIDIESTTLRVHNTLCVGKRVTGLFISYLKKSKNNWNQTIM